jgi:TRAP-type C4-dicarboxylate transport system permease small subunit
VPLLDQIGDPLKVVATAVTPVVMVSATAILASGVNTRYISISDRVRALAREYRDVNTPSNRRSTIRLEMVIFHRRLHLVSWAARVLYSAVGCFIAVALLISISLSKPIPAGITLAAFLIGLILTAVAIILQLLELQQSNRTIDLESADVLGDLET